MTMRLPIIAILVSVGVATLAADSKSVQARESLERHMRANFDAWNTHDPKRVAAHEPASYGFGFRVRDSRMPKDEAEYVEGLKKFFAPMKYYRIIVEEMKTAIYDDVGIAWGVFIEDFQVDGRPPEKLRVRFTKTLKYDGTKWRPILYHRDIQPFDASGRYMPTAAESGGGIP